MIKKIKHRTNRYDILLNIFLTVLLYIPGMYHAFYTYLKGHDKSQELKK